MAANFNMPFKGERIAPTFDESNPRTLTRFFRNLEDCFARAAVASDRAKKDHAVRYVEPDVEDIWSALGHFDNGTYAEWKAEVVALYPGASEDRKYTRQDAEDLVSRWQAHGFPTIGDWSSFYREFLAISSWLKSKNKMSDGERDRLAWRAIPDSAKPAVSQRLQIKNPDVVLGEWTAHAVNEAMTFLLSGTSSSTSSFRANSVTPSPGVASSTSVKIEETNQLLAQLVKALIDQRATPAVAPARSTMSGSTTCHYCSEVGHQIAQCPRVEEDAQKGLCRRNAEGRIVLPSGAFPPRSLTGNNMRERIQEWHKLHPGNVAVGMLSYVPEPAAPGPTQPDTSRSQMLWEIIDPPSETTQSASTFALENEEEARIADLQRELLALQRKAALRRSPRNHDGSVPKVAPASAPEPQVAPVADPKPVPTTTVAPPNVELDAAPEHPFAKAKDATYTPPQQSNVGALPKAKEKSGPTYRTVAPANNPKTVEQVVERILKAPAPGLNNEELFSIAPQICDKLRAYFTPKRVPTETATMLQATFETNPKLPSVEEILEVAKQQGKLPRGVVRIPDPYEIYLSRLGPDDNPMPLTVARESHALRSIVANVNNRLDVECVYDSGSQIVSMSEAVCHALGLSYDPTIILNMQSANGTTDRSLGLARNVPFRIGDLVFYLQVHVIREAAYDILLGRPIDVLGASVVRNYRNEDQTVELHDPNSDLRVTVPTFPRGRAFQPSQSPNF